MSKISKNFVTRIRRSGRWARRKFARAPRAVRVAGVVAIVLAALVLTNLMYHVIRKPTELFFFVGHKLDKEPTETWRHYGPLFRTYSTRSITPELPLWPRSKARATRWIAPTGAGDLASIPSQSISPHQARLAFSR
jgi:hypothetical protein